MAVRRSKRPKGLDYILYSALHRLDKFTSVYIDPIDTNVARQAKLLCTEVATYSSSRVQIYQTLTTPFHNAFKNAYPPKTF